MRGDTSRTYSSKFCQRMCGTSRREDESRNSGNWIERSKDKTAYFKEEAAIIAKENRVAVILTGGNRDYTQMEQLLNSTGIEYFGMARPFLSEPDLPNRYEKQYTKKTRCVSCNACMDPKGDGSCILNCSV